MKTNKIIKTIGMSIVGIFGVGAIIIPTMVLSSCSDADKPKEETKITFDKHVNAVKQSLYEDKEVMFVSHSNSTGVCSLSAQLQTGEDFPPEIKFSDNHDGTGTLTILKGANLLEDQVVEITAMNNGIENSTLIVINNRLNEEKLVYSLVGETSYEVSVIDNSQSVISGELVIPHTHEGKPVTQIKAKGFENQNLMTSVDIPASIISIGERAFQNCSALENIVIPESVDILGSSSFFGCSNLSEVKIDPGLTSIEADVFFNCAKLNTVIIPHTITLIEKSAFFGCVSLNHIDVTGNPNFTMVGGVDQYSGCLIKGKTLDDDCGNVVTAIKHVFLQLPSSIVERAFEKCGSLISVTLGSNIIKIGFYTFNFCINLISVTFNPNVNSVSDSSFDNCYNLKTIILGTNTNFTLVGGMDQHTGCLVEGKTLADDCSNIILAIGNITLPDTIEYICPFAFQNAGGLLTSIVIPNGVSTIGNASLRLAKNLTTVTIGSGVTKIESNNFLYAPLLSNITINAIIPPILPLDIFKKMILIIKFMSQQKPCLFINMRRLQMGGLTILKLTW